MLKVESLGLVQQNEHVKCRDGSCSALVNGRAVWTFNDTCMDDGGVLGDQFIDNTLAGSKKLKVSVGITLTRDLEDVEGVPVQYITCVKNTGFLAQELPLTKVVFGQPAKAD